MMPNERNGGRALIAEQRSDGGWSQLPTMTSDAYATGQALYALAESGALRATVPAHGVAVYLLDAAVTNPQLRAALERARAGAHPRS